MGFISNENHKWSNKNEGISFGTEEKICSFRHRALTSLTRARKWNVLYPPTCCPSSLPRWVTQGYTTWILRLFHQADLKFSGPVLNCHTCSYMNDQGICLQGEGVCSTQNSQQCMLKKIFEGMWGLHEPVFAREHINQLEYWWGGDRVAGAKEGTAVIPQKLGDPGEPYPFKNQEQNSSYWGRGPSQQAYDVLKRGREIGCLFLLKKCVGFPLRHWQ